MRRSLLGAFSVVVSFLSAVPALADQPAFVARTSFAHIETGSPDFAAPSVTIAATTQVGAGVSGSVPLNFYASPEIAGLSTSTSGGVSLSGVSLDPSGEIVGVATSSGAGGTFTFNEHYAAGADPLGFGPLYRYASADALAPFPYLPQFARGDLPVLELFLPITGAGLVDSDGTFTVGLSIAGDYSTTAGLDSGSGQHFLNYLDPAWTITTNFVYDPLTDLTTFTAVNSAYKYAVDSGDLYDQSPQLDVFFIGAAPPVPEPAVWGMLLSGLGVLGFSHHRRRTAAIGDQGNIAAA